MWKLKYFCLTGFTGRTLPDEVYAPPIDSFKRKYSDDISKDVLQELCKCEQDFHKIFKFPMTP